MFAHQVINTLENKFAPKSGEQFKKICAKIIHEIRNSQQFHFGEANDIRYIFHPNKSKKKTKNDDVLGDFDAFANPLDSDLRLPYPKCWFDYITDFNSESYEPKYKEKVLEIMKDLDFHLSVKKGILIHEVIPNCLLSCINFALGSNDGTFWSFTPNVYYISLGKPLSENSEAVMGLLNDKDAPRWIDDYRINEKVFSETVNTIMRIPGNVYPVPMTDPEIITKIVPPSVVAADMSNLKLVEESMRLLNCKNIVTEEVDNTFKMKVGKKTKVVKSKTKFKYHVLNAVVPNSRKKYINGSKTNRTVRVHMCRGFYRHYVEGISKGMFGKYFGRYWIPDHVRGNKKKGLVQKDYNIKINPDLDPVPA